MRGKPREYPTAVCKNCDKEFPKKRTWMVYCCDQCRYEYYDMHIRPLKKEKEECSLQT